LVLSTSGNSDNLVYAVRTARERGLLTAALLGGRGGKLAKQVERSLIVPHPSTQRIQEEHIFIIHLLVELIESDLFG
jgi:D-sedoheptulose 7-phosphate isomerase